MLDLRKRIEVHKIPQCKISVTSQEIFWDGPTRSVIQNVETLTILHCLPTILQPMTFIT